MSQLLDLAITLTPPPSDAQPDVIAGISLNSGKPLGLNHSGDLLKDPLTKQERADLRWYLEEYWKWPYEGFAQRARGVEGLLPKLGKRLYESVFGSRQADRIVQKWLSTEGEHQISVMSEIPQVLSLPWELLHSEQGYMVMRTQEPVSILRSLPQSESTTSSMPFEPPLRVLLVTARPEKTGFIDPRGIARELLDEVQGQIETGAIELEFLRPPTLKALRQRLRDRKRQVHVVHFDGHGTFDEKMDGRDEHLLSGSRRGKLAFEDDKGQLELVEAEDLAQVLQNSRVKLAVLTACQSAMSSADDAFSSVAARLIQGGIDAVVAMSASLLEASATLYVEAFYRAIAEGIPAPLAQEQARQALHDEPARHIIRRRRDEEGQPVELRDWWLPHFYQQRPLELRPTRPSGQLEQKSTSSVRLSESMPAEPRYGFSGRAYELLHIERFLLRDQLVVIQGFGGIGKTALVRETADWLTRTRMYDAALFVSFEHGGGAATLLGALGTFLGVYDGHYNPNDTKAAVAKVEPALKEKRTLVIADNMESILPGGDAPLEAGVRTQLWDVLLKLSNMGTGVLLTTRDTAFGDGKLAPGKHVAYVSLKGLHPEDAYALASRLLEYLRIDRAKAPYAELRDLLKQLDYHPLAIQLVLPALGESALSLAKIKADFASLLDHFADDTETGRNRSLLASLDYSLRRLSEAQRTLLPRLALFEGGASEDDLLAITEIPETEWVKLRQALEQAALLTAEQVGSYTAPFLHFHPVLAPYLRSQQGTDGAALRERYTQRYSDLADYLYREDTRHPQAVRALVQKELPNLRHVLDLLLEAGDLDTASQMVTSIARFLDYFGLLRERDELRRRVGEAVAAKGMQESGELTQAEFLRESGLGEDELQRGKIRAAYTRFTTLLARIEALPEGAPLGRGSYEHCLTLVRLGRCLESGGQAAAAEESLRKALTVIEALVSRQPENKSYIRMRGQLLGEQADVLTDQGKYSQAREAYEEALEIDEQIGDLRNQGVDLEQLGALALRQRDYVEAQARYAVALQLFQSLGEQASEAVVWHQLGIVAEEQKTWAEAERCYRESLTIKEQLGDAAGAAITCNQLALVSVGAGRPVEAEGWHRRAIELKAQVEPGSSSHAISLSNLADLLVNEVRAGRASMTRLAEAKRYSEQALAIDETLDASAEIWKDFAILAEIADLEGHAEEARDYRRREREAYAAFAGNRYHIDRQHGQLIAAIAAAAQGDAEAREEVEAALPQLEEGGWKIAAATRRIWAGERDWASLVEEVDSQDALLILRVLETIAQPAGVQGKTLEEVIASLPITIREALEQGDEVAFDKAFEALSPEEQQVVVEAMQYLQAQQDEEVDDEDEELDIADVIQQFEPLLQAIAMATGDSTHRDEILETLAELETNLEVENWEFREVVQRIWAEERDAIALTAGMDEMDTALVNRVLEIIAEAGR
jgi:tetratricopeptide (TPR) repeat protein